MERSHRKLIFYCAMLLNFHNFGKTRVPSLRSYVHAGFRACDVLMAKTETHLKKDFTIQQQNLFCLYIASTYRERN